MKNTNKKNSTLMAYNEKLTEKVRTALSTIPGVEEKRMFSGITFMVNGKMCISVGDDRIMCRIDPAIQNDALKKTAVRPVIMKGREYKGYVYIGEEGINVKEDFDYWIRLALDFNRKMVVGSR